MQNLIRDDIPLGSTYDQDGRVLSYKDSTGLWREYTYNQSGRELSYEDSTGFWSEYTYDHFGRMLTFKDSTGSWREYTYDQNGCKLSHKTAGFSGIRIADDGDIEHYKTAKFSAPSYTLQELRDYCDSDWFRGEPMTSSDFVQCFGRWLDKEKLKQDPEYDKYLELKKKFEE